MSEEEAAAATKRKIFRWVDLPAEMRNIIYQKTLTHDGPIALCHGLVHNRHRVRQERIRIGYFTKEDYEQVELVPNLLLLNKATYAEAGPMLYGQNKLSFNNCQSLYHFLYRLGPTTKSWITEISLEALNASRSMRSAFMFSAFQEMIGTTNLRCLKLEGVAPWDDMDKQSKLLISNAYDWLLSVVKQKGSAKAAMDMLHINNTVTEKDWKWTHNFRYHFIAHQTWIQSNPRPSPEVEAEQRRQGLERFRERLEVHLVGEYRWEASKNRSKPTSLDCLLNE